MLHLILRVTAVAAAAWKRIRLAADRLRRLMLWGALTVWGRRRDMLYLRDGFWMDISRSVDPEQVAWFYDSENHRLRCMWEPVETRSNRWDWLSAVETAGARRDLTPWLEGLRVPRSVSAPTTQVVLALFAHQNGWMPRGALRVTRRDGTEEQVESTAV